MSTTVDPNDRFHCLNYSYKRFVQATLENINNDKLVIYRPWCLDVLNPRPLILLVNSALALSTTPWADIEDISQEGEAHSLCSAATRSQDEHGSAWPRLKRFIFERNTGETRTSSLFFFLFLRLFFLRTPRCSPSTTKVTRLFLRCTNQLYRTNPFVCRFFCRIQYPSRFIVTERVVQTRSIQRKTSTPLNGTQLHTTRINDETFYWKNLF